jgi:hypothetical protein
MRQNLLPALLLLLVSVPLAACGGPSPDAPLPAVHWNESKHMSAVGQMRAAVVDRPAPDRAWIEAEWTARPHAAHEAEGAPGACALEIALPEGVFLLEGDFRTPLASDEPSGSQRWLVGFPTGRALDAVLRYCVDTPQGPRAAEVAVRLTEDAPAR